MKDDVAHLRHALECIRRVEEHASGGWPRFRASHTIQDAVLRNLQTMAESTQRLSPERKAGFPAVDWPRIAAFRNVLVHNYLGIDLALVWLVIEREIPPLRATLVLMLGETEGS